MTPSVVVRGTGPIWQYEMTWEPEMVKGGDEALVYRREYTLVLPKPMTPVAVGSFLGVDTGDIVECHAEVSVPPTGFRLYARSLHKETNVAYDAWDWQDLDEPPCRQLNVNVLCRVTGRNWYVFTKRFNPLTAYFHPCVVLEVSE